MNQPSIVKPINIEQFSNNRLDNIIPKRNQYSNLRYEVISESLFFENKRLIEEACKVLQTNNDAKQKQLEQKDYVTTFAQRFCPQLNSFSDSIIIQKSQLMQQQEQEKSVFPTQELIKIIMENLADGEAKHLQSKIQTITDGLAHTKSIVLELTLEEYQAFKGTETIKKNNFILEQLRERIILQNNGFWNNNNFLLQKYRAETESLQQYQQIKDDQLIIFIKGKEIKTLDYLVELEKEYIIENNILKLVGHCSQPIKTFKPLYECSILHSNQKMMNCILQLDSLERQTKFTTLKQKLMPFFGEQDSFQTFECMLSILEHARQIIKWENLLKTFFEDTQGQSKLTQSVIMQKSKANISYVRQTLEACYQQLQPRFRDQFYNFKDEKEIENYIEKPHLVLFGDYSGHCAYEVFPQGLIVYFQFQEIQGTVRSCYSMLHYQYPNPNDQANKNTKSDTKNEYLKEDGDLGQLILADIEDGKPVIKKNFKLSQHYYNAFQTHLKENQKQPEIQKLIIDVLVRIVAIRTKRLILNPTTREEKDIIFHDI